MKNSLLVFSALCFACSTSFATVFDFSRYVGMASVSAPVTFTLDARPKTADDPAYIADCYDDLFQPFQRSGTYWNHGVSLGGTVQRVILTAKPVGSGTEIELDPSQWWVPASQAVYELKHYSESNLDATVYFDFRQATGTGLQGNGTPQSPVQPCAGVEEHYSEYIASILPAANMPLCVGQPELLDMGLLNGYVLSGNTLFASAAMQGGASFLRPGEPVSIVGFSCDSDTGKCSFSVRTPLLPEVNFEDWVNASIEGAQLQFRTSSNLSAWSSVPASLSAPQSYDATTETLTLQVESPASDAGFFQLNILDTPTP